MAEQKEDKRSDWEKLQDSNAVLILFVISFIAFLLTGNVIFAVLSGLSLISIFGLDILVGAKTHGIKQELIELAIAVVIALVIWFGIVFLLGTSSPISAIVSCSLLPNYQRGDMVVLQGVQASAINAPTVELTQDEFASISNTTQPSCGAIGPIAYDCVQSCPRDTFPGGQPTTPSPECIRAITVHNVTYYENLSDDVIVYSPYINGTPVEGDIIHRVFLKLKVGNDYYLLTKGDNNDFIDATVYDIISQKNVKGRVAFRVPILGYLKLFISGYFAEPEGCDTVLLH